jgi:hypothetical protein
MRTVPTATTALFLTAASAHAQPKPATHFALAANPAFLACLAANPSGPPQAVVAVRRGELNDLVVVRVSESTAARSPSS